MCRKSPLSQKEPPPRHLSSSPPSPQLNRSYLAQSFGIRASQTDGGIQTSLGVGWGGSLCLEMWDVPGFKELRGVAHFVHFNLTRKQKKKTIIRMT